MRAEALGRPGFAEAEETALNGTGGGMLLDDAIRLWHQRHQQRPAHRGGDGHRPARGIRGRSSRL
jgi:hypothetical protein